MQKKNKKTKQTVVKELNQVAAVDLTKKRDDAAIPVATEILAQIALAVGEGRLAISGLATPEDHTKSGKKLFVEVVEPILRKHNIKVFDLAYIFQIMLFPIENIKETTISSLNDALDNTIDKFFEKRQGDVTIEDIISKQQKFADESVDNSAVAKSK